MFRRTKQLVIVLIAAVLLATGCSGEPPDESAANTAIDTGASPEGHSGVPYGQNIQPARKSLLCHEL